MKDWMKQLTKQEAIRQGFTMITHEYERSETEMLADAYTQLARSRIPAAVVRQDNGLRTLWRKF